nr:ABC transporter ATP-binding protein [uncultured Desulfobulbus sp.]
MIEIEHIHKTVQGKKVLIDFSLQVDKQKIVALIGPSGCGKTSLLRLIAGLDVPNKGKITIEGIPVNNPKILCPAHQRKVGMIFQDLALWPHMTARQHLQYVFGQQKAAKFNFDDKIETMLSAVNLNSHASRYPHQLSGGEQQRLAIIRALAQEPNYLLMDEPFSSLDPILKTEMESFVSHVQKESKIGILYVTHNLRDLEQITDKIAVMKHGRLVQFGDRNDVLSRPINEFVEKMTNISNQ